MATFSFCVCVGDTKCFRCRFCWKSSFLAFRSEHSDSEDTGRRGLVSCALWQGTALVAPKCARVEEKRRRYRHNKTTLLSWRYVSFFFRKKHFQFGAQKQTTKSNLFFMAHFTATTTNNFCFALIILYVCAVECARKTYFRSCRWNSMNYGEN